MQVSNRGASCSLGAGEDVTLISSLYAALTLPEHTSTSTVTALRFMGTSAASPPEAPICSIHRLIISLLHRRH
jgi:hypothetical protein